MPTRPPKPCTKPGCKAYAVKRGRCIEHPANGGWAKKDESPSLGWKWTNIKKAVLKRDNYLCVTCVAQDRLSRAVEVDHEVPRSRGGTDDPSNLRSLCSTCHKQKSYLERRFPRKRIRPPAVPVVLVCGPPGAGKTTYCLDHIGEHDQLIDFDKIVEEISGETRRTVDATRWVGAAISERNRRIDALADCYYGTAYVPMSLPKRYDRMWWRDRLNAKVIMLLETPELCLDRIAHDPSRGPQERDKGKAGLISWFENYVA